MMPGDPVLGGVVLRRAAEQSPNYVAGVSGWTINADGTVEFNSGTFRGTVTAGTFAGTDFEINQSGAFFYNGTPAAGNLKFSIASSAGTDRFGNAYQNGFTAYYGGGGYLSFNAGEIDFSPAGTHAVGAISPGTGELDLTAQVQNATDNQASLVLKSQPSGTPAQVITSALAAILPGGGISTPETWHTMTLTGGWSAMSGNIAPRYRLLPTGRVSIQGALTLPSSGSYNSVTFATLPAGYFRADFAARAPIAYLGNYPSSYTAIVGSPRLFLSTAGGLQLGGIPSGENSQNVDISCVMDLT